MTQEDEGARSQGVPPSFIPAGSRRRPSAESAPSVADGSPFSRTQSAPSTPVTSFAPAASGVTPPSFAPAPSRASARHAQRSSQATPASFTPRSGASASATPRAARSTGSSGGTSAASTPAPAIHGPAEQPRSFSPTPARVARRSSGSSNIAGARRPDDAARAIRASHPASVRPVPTDHAERNSGVQRVGRLGGSGTRTLHRFRHRAPHIILGTLAVLVIALILAVFGAWHWVDSRLNTEDGWLTSAANTSATTWLILGSDERDGTTGGSADDTPGFRTDTILVLTKPKNGPSSLISIPRDSLTQVDGTYMKINAVAQLNGNQALVGTVEQITGQKIDHIAKIKFGGLTNVVDAAGGVNLCYDETVSDPYSGLDWQAGCHVADGATALAFSRMRYADANGDFGRAQRQRQVISAIVSKVSSKEVLGNPAKAMKVADAGLAAVTFDSKTTTATLIDMALTFKNATGSDGVTGSVYWTDPGYQVDGVGSSVLLDDTKNTELFSELAAGTHKAGTVGTLAENS